jgi:hypothetical protein
MTHFLNETREAVKRSGHTPEDIFFIGSSDGVYGLTWDEFTEVAAFDYDSGYGSSEIPPDLIVVFTNGQKMWRGEYDGSEWWEYDSDSRVDYSHPTKKITNLRGGLWESVAELNGGEDY